MADTRAKWLIVKRDPADALRSFMQMEEYPGLGKITPMNAANAFGRMMDHLAELEKSVPCFTIRYDDLDSEPHVREAFSYLVGDVQPWVPWHWEQMRHLRITTRPETVNVFGEG